MLLYDDVVYGTAVTMKSPEGLAGLLPNVVRSTSNQPPEILEGQEARHQVAIPMYCSRAWSLCKIGPVVCSLPLAQVGAHQQPESKQHTMTRPAGQLRLLVLLDGPATGLDANAAHAYVLHWGRICKSSV